MASSSSAADEPWYGHPMTSPKRPTSRLGSWSRRLDLVQAACFTALFLTVPPGTVQLLFGFSAVVFVVAAFIRPGEAYYRRLIAEERKALESGP